MANQDIATAVQTLTAAIAEQITSAMLSQPQGGAAERRSDGCQGAGGAADCEVLAIAVRAVQLYAETHPRPPHVTQKEAAAMLRMSEPTIRKLIQSGALKLNRAGRIPIAQVDELAALPGTPHVGPKAT